MWLDVYFYTHNLDGSVKEHIGATPTAFGTYLDEGLDSEEVDKLVKEKTRKGKSRNVREIDDLQELKELFEDLIEGADESDAWGDYDGPVYKQKDGTLIGLREKSRSGGSTIDIEYPNGKDIKVHLPMGNGK